MRMVIKLKTFDSLNVKCCHISSLINHLPKILPQSKRCIIATRQHKSIQQLLHRQYISCLQISTRASYITSNSANCHFLLLHINLKFPSQLNHRITCHNLGQTSHLPLQIFPFSKQTSHLIDIINCPTFGRNIRHIFINFTNSRTYINFFQLDFFIKLRTCLNN